MGFAGGIPREDGSAENVLLRLHETLAVCGTARNLFRARRALSARKRPRRPGRGLAGTLAQTPRAVPAKPSGRVFRKRIGTGSDRSASRVREDLLPHRAVPVSAPRAGHERRRPDSGIAARGTPDAGTAHARRKRNVFDALFSRIGPAPPTRRRPQRKGRLAAAACGGERASSPRRTSTATPRGGGERGVRGRRILPGRRG